MAGTNVMCPRCRHQFQIPALALPIEEEPPWNLSGWSPADLNFTALVRAAPLSGGGQVRGRGLDRLRLHKRCRRWRSRSQFGPSGDSATRLAGLGCPSYHRLWLCF